MLWIIGYGFSFQVCHFRYTDPGRGGSNMIETRVRKNESLDAALRRFKRSCAKDGVLSEIRKRERYEKPSIKRKKKAEAARKKRK